MTVPIVRPNRPLPCDFMVTCLSAVSFSVNYYKLWNEVMEKANLREGVIGKPLSFYSLRHFGITCRLYAGVPHYAVAKLAGTSVTFIEKHYEHMDMGKLAQSATKSFHIDKDGMVVREYQEERM